MNITPFYPRQSRGYKYDPETGVFEFWGRNGSSDRYERGKKKLVYFSMGIM